MALPASRGALICGELPWLLCFGSRKASTCGKEKEFWLPNEMGPCQSRRPRSPAWRWESAIYPVWNKKRWNKMSWLNMIEHQVCPHNSATSAIRTLQFFSSRKMLSGGGRSIVDRMQRTRRFKFARPPSHICRTSWSKLKLGTVGHWTLDHGIGHWTLELSLN